MVLAVLEHPKALGKTFNVVDDERVSYREFFSRYGDAFGFKIRQVPALLLVLLAFVLELGARIINRNPLVTRKIIRYFCIQGWFDNKHARHSLGFRPPFSPAEAMRLTIAYIRSRE